MSNFSIRDSPKTSLFSFIHLPVNNGGDPVLISYNDFILLTDYI